MNHSRTRRHECNGRLAGNRRNGRPPAGPRRTGRRNSVASRNGAAARNVILLPSFHSEATGEALLQSSVARNADRIAVAYGQDPVQFELSARGEALIAGAWEMEIHADNRPLGSSGVWSPVCWNCDEDGDYLELQLETGAGLRVDRQFLLSRTDHFAVLADAVVMTGAQRIAYVGQIPLGEFVRAQSDRFTRECCLAGQHTAARVYPLSLPQGRSQSAAGSCESRDGSLRLAQQAAGCALYSALIIDWHPRRRRALAEWRALTVSELGRAVPHDQASAFRWRVGGQQLVVYRSLRDSGEPRAVLGHHTWYETMIGTFGRDGEVGPIIIVDAS